MDENNVAVEQVVETETTQTNSPQVEKPITGAETMQGETVQPPVVEEADVPVDTLEQRRAFQEMRLENKRLKEEMAARPEQESAFKVLKTQAPVVTGPVMAQNFTDPTTGETDWTQFNAAQQQREQALVAQARAEAQSAVQESLDEERARDKYPELMTPGSTTEKQIASRWLWEKMQGNTVSISDIASEFARNFKQAVSKAEKVGAERILNEVSEKEKAGLQAVSQSPHGVNRVTSQEDASRLSAMTRSGNADAITARISKIPWANK